MEAGVGANTSGRARGGGRIHTALKHCHYQEYITFDKQHKLEVETETDKIAGVFALCNEKHLLFTIWKEIAAEFRDIVLSKDSKNKMDRRDIK